MSDQDVPKLPMARLAGYDKAAVDDFVQSQASRIEQERTRARSAHDHCEELRAELARLRDQLAEVENPSYAGLGVRAAESLARAEEQADGVLTHARQQADQVRQAAERDAAALRVEAAEEAEAEQAVQSEQILAARAELLTEAQRERDRAHAQATQILTRARADAEDTRVAAAAEAEAVRANAAREAEKTQTIADREVAECQRALESEREAHTTQIADAHTAVTDRITRLLQQSEARTTAAHERARVMVSAAAQQHDHAHAEAGRLLAQARRDAEWLVTRATIRIEQETANRQGRAERDLVRLRHETEELRRRRDGVVAQLSPVHRPRPAVDARHTSEEVTENDEAHVSSARCADDRLLTSAEVAATFQVAPESVTRWAAEGTLPYVRVEGGHRRFRERAVQDALGNRSCG